MGFYRGFVCEIPNVDFERSTNLTTNSDLWEESPLLISVYDSSDEESFLGKIEINLPMLSTHEQWFPLIGRTRTEVDITGEILLQANFEGYSAPAIKGPEDFRKLKLIGKGSAGPVYLVRKRDTGRLYVMKVYVKSIFDHMAVIEQTKPVHSAFVACLKMAFQTSTDFRLLSDYQSGGELYWHLQRLGRFEELIAKFYIAEFVLALTDLHQKGILYCPLKPENILLDPNGHAILVDFGLRLLPKQEGGQENLYSDLIEYTSPEELLGEAPTKTMNFWSLGVLLFEMCFGWRSFYAKDTQQMYNIVFGKVRFPSDVLSPAGINFIRGLLKCTPAHRLGFARDTQELMEHEFFSDVDWADYAQRKTIPPIKPRISPTTKIELDVSDEVNDKRTIMDPKWSTVRDASARTFSGGPSMPGTFTGNTLVEHTVMEKYVRKPAFDGEDEGEDEGFRKVRLSASTEVDEEEILGELEVG